MSHATSIGNLPLWWRGKPDHSLVQNKVEVKPSIAGRPCLPPVAGLSCSADHQDGHQQAQLQPEQDLPAPAPGHRSKLQRQHQANRQQSPDGVFLSPRPSAHCGPASHSVRTDLRGMKFSSVDRRPISWAADVCGQRRREVLCSLSLTLNHFSTLCHRVHTTAQDTCLSVWFTVSFIGMRGTCTFLSYICSCSFFWVIYALTLPAGFLSSAPCPSVPLSGKQMHLAIHCNI